MMLTHPFQIGVTCFLRLWTIPSLNAPQEMLGIPNRLLKNVADEIAPSLCYVFNLSLSLGVFPTNWKFANIAPVFKTDDPTLPSLKL